LYGVLSCSNNNLLAKENDEKEVTMDVLEKDIFGLKGKQYIMVIAALLAVSMAIIGCGDGDNENHAPVIDNLIAPDKVDAGASVEFQVIAHDADGDALTYTWKVEAGQLSSAAVRNVTWTAPPENKSVNITVRVSDGVNKPVIESKTITVVVRSNSSPTIDELIVPNKVHAGDSVELQVKAHDADGDALTYAWGVEAGQLSCSGKTQAVTWTVPIREGSVTVSIKVSDGVSKPTIKSKTVTVSHPLIVPGRQAAGIKLGDPFDRVKELYGKPSEVDGRLFAYWEPDIGLSGFLDGIDLVEDLFLMAPNKSKTAGGNGIGSTLKSVESEFGRAEEIEELKHWYWKKGIEFDYDDKSIVTDIFIFKPIGAAPARLIDLVQRKQEIRNKSALEKHATKKMLNP
jgi:hypothetical protein